MNLKHANSSGALTLIRAMAAGAALSALIAAVGCLLCAVMMDKQLLPDSAGHICPAAICVMAAVPGCLLAQALAGRARLPVSLGSGALLLLAMAAARALLRTGSAASWISLPVVGTCAVIAALIGAGRGR